MNAHPIPATSGAIPAAQPPAAIPNLPTAATAPPPPVATVAADVVAAAPPLVATADAKRIAGAILEVLAGVRSITDAAMALGVAPSRYYQLEARALMGLITACEPRACGRPAGGSLQAEVDRLRAERDRLREEAARYQALARIAQSAFGSTAPALASVATGGRAAPAAADAPKTRKRRVATVRALRLARQVQERAASPGASSTAATTRGTSGGDQAGG